jgi:hypothetical protein
VNAVMNFRILAPRGLLNSIMMVFVNYVKTENV